MRSSTPPIRLGVEAPGSLRSETGVRQSHITDHQAPADFVELYDRYYGYVVRFVRARGIHPSEVEDVTQTILLHFFRRDSLSYFNPEHQVTVDGELKSVRFTTFLSGFVIKYLQHHLSTQGKNEARAMQRLNTSDGDPLDEDSWINRQGPRVEADHSAPEYAELVSTIHQRLSTKSLRGSGTCDLVALFEAMREQIALTGKYDTKALSEHFGAPVSTVQNWIKRLRVEIKGV